MRRFCFFIVLLFAIVIGNIRCKESEDLDCKAMETTAPVSKRLKEHLFCEYDSSVRPTLNERKPTPVNVRMVPQYVDFSEEQNILSFHTWVSMQWPDAHLTWEPSKWENSKELHVLSYEVWKPDLTVFNAGEFGFDEGLAQYVDCLVTFNGTVTCVMPAKFSSHCPTDYSEWPYDKHNCTMQIGAWLLFHDEILMHFEDDAILLHSLMPNKEWNVHIEDGSPQYYPRVKDDDEGGELMIFINVLLQRHGSRLAIIYILPAFVFMVLTLIVLWLDSQSSERLLVACINFICHLIGLFDLHWYFPNTRSETTPKILIFYEVSIGLGATALIVTCLLRKLRSTSVPAPTWLSSSTTLILNSPIGGLLTLNFSERKKDAAILEDTETNGQIAETTRDRTWQELAIILECLSFVISFFIYLVMLTIVLPPGAPKKQRMSYWLY